MDRTTTDLVLNYDPPVLSLDSQEAPEKPDPRFAKIPLIQFQDVPLPIAIEGLARQAELNFTFDRTLDIARSDVPQPVVTFRWQNMSAMQALIALLDVYGLEWRESSKTGVALVRRIEPGGRRLAYVGADLQEKIQALIRKSILRPEGEYSKERCLNGSQGFELTLNSPPQTKPARVVLRTAKTLNCRDVIEFLPTNMALSGVETTGLRVEGDNNRFQVLLNPPPFTAKEYLAWSDQFISEFDTMRGALKRPNARMEGDYQEPHSAPIPNFVSYRSVVQTLAQRAQCFLLLGRPEDALHDLTLIHKLSLSLEVQSSGLVTLVTTLTKSAVVGLYVDVVAEGLRRQVWREPQLAVINEQLEQVDLLGLGVQAFRCERVATVRMAKYARAHARERSNLLEDLRKLPGYRLFPRGWFEQNYVVIANVGQTLIESFDMTNRVVLPDKTRQFADELESISKGFRPYTYLAAIGVPDYTRAVQSISLQQTRANQAQVACALERHRFAIGQYPEALEVLSPRFLKGIPHDVIGGQPLKYHRERDNRFLLYSVGWNKSDDHGTAILDADGSANKSKGDWVWQAPEAERRGRFTAN